MTIQHTFISPKADGPDATLVRPSNWNAAHTLPSLANLGLLPLEQPDYLVFIGSDGLVKGRNERTGVIDYSNADVGVVLNAIIQALPSSTVANEVSGGLIRIMRGVYNQSTVIQIDRRGVVIIGSGRKHGTTFNLAANLGAGRAMFEIGAYNASGVLQDTAILQDVYISDFLLYGKRQDGTITTSKAIRCACSNVYLERIVAQEFNDTPFTFEGASSTNKSFQGFVIDCQATNFGRNGVYTANGMEFSSNLSDWDVIRAYNYQGTVNQDRGNHGIEVNGGGTIRFINCHTWFNKGDGIHAGSGTHLSFFGCISESNQRYGLFIENPDDIQILGGSYYGNDRAATDGAATNANVRLAGVSRGKVLGVTFEKNISSAPNVVRNLWIVSSIAIEVANCSFVDAQTDHIAVTTNTTDVHIHDNTFLPGIAYGDIVGRTPSTAIRIDGSGSTRIKVHDNTITTMGIVEQSSTDGNIIENNEFVTSGSVTGIGVNSRIRQNKGDFKDGAVVASANDFDPVYSVRHVIISGTTTINGIRTARFDKGDRLVMEFQASLTLTDAGSPGAGYAPIVLNVGNFTTAAGDKVTVSWNGTNFVEIARVDFT